MSWQKNTGHIPHIRGIYRTIKKYWKCRTHFTPCGSFAPPSHMSCHPKWHRDQLSHFCKGHQCAQQTHRPHYIFSNRPQLELMLHIAMWPNNNKAGQHCSAHSICKQYLLTNTTHSGECNLLIGKHELFYLLDSLFIVSSAHDQRRCQSCLLYTSDAADE